MTPPISYEEWLRRLAEAVEPTPAEWAALAKEPDDVPALTARRDALTAISETSTHSEDHDA